MVNSIPRPKELLFFDFLTSCIGETLQLLPRRRGWNIKTWTMNSEMPQNLWEVHTGVNYFVRVGKTKKSPA